MNICRTQMIYFLLIILVFTAAAGCSTVTKPDVYIHPNPGFNRIKKVAIMPFDNFSRDSKASEKVRNNFVFEFLNAGIFNVMDISEVDSKLLKAGIPYGTSQIDVPTRLSRNSVNANSIPLSKKIGDVLNVEAIVAGAVETYKVDRIAGQVVPEVNVSARLIDTETSTTIWSSNHGKRSTGVPVLGWGRITSLNILSREVVEEMVNSLSQNAR